MKEKGSFDRREFLRIGGGGVVAFTVDRVFGQAPVSTETGVRRAPVDPIILKSPQLEVVLDRYDGVPYQYRLLPARSTFLGEELGRQFEATVCNRDSWTFSKTSLLAQSVATAPAVAEFRYVVTIDNQQAAGFAIRYALQGATVTVTMLNVQEDPGFELIDVSMPSLVTVREEDGAAWLAHGDTGGSLAMLSAARNGSLPPNRFWGKVLATLPITMLGNGKAVCAQEVTAFMDGTELAVAGAEGHRRASLGTVKSHRVNGSQCFDMNTGDDATTKNCGNRNTPNLLIGQPSSCRLDFLAATDWLQAAQVVRKRMPPIPKHIYDDAFTYGILLDQPLFEKPTATFEDCGRIIREVASLTDGARQIVHLWGFQYKGKDSGYPAVDQIDPRVGSYEQMMSLMQRAKDFNCTVTLSDNYDDAYRSSPAWNPAFIARRPDGELWESRNWTGENSYILGMAKYVKASALERVRYTCEHYNLPETTHVDVLSYYSIRNDWDHEQPASGVTNLVEGRYKIIEEFARHGVDVSSEALRYAFIGKMSSFWYMTGPSPCPFGGKPIPFLATIYRKSAVWGQSGRMNSLTEGLLKMLFYNGYAHASFRGTSDMKATADMYFLMMLPWFKLHTRNIESFRRQGERTFIGLEGNASIEIDWSKQSYAATVDGVEIARDSATYCQLDDRRIAFYSSTARELSTPLPSGWNPSEITAMALSTSGRREFPVQIRKGRIIVAVRPQEPVIVYRHKDDARPRPS